MNTILFSDIDGTLFMDGEISKENIEAIRRFRAAGNTFMLCTGRMPPSVQVFLSEQPQLECDGAVLAEGAGVFLTKGNPLKLELLEQKMIDKQIAWDIMTYVYEKEPKTTLHWSDGPRCMSIHERFETRPMGVTPEFRSFDEWKAENGEILTIVLGNIDGNSEDTKRVQRDIAKRWGQYTVSFINTHALDITAAGTDKGYGLLRAVQLLNPNSRYFGVGDSFNDVPMFEALGKDKAFFIESGEATLKHLAHISVSTVAECIEHIMENQ